MIHCTFENGNKTSLRHAVVDIIVLKDNQVLLIKRSPKISEGGKWAIIGGFVDRDETLTEAATREVFEETGYRIKNLSLLTIRDNPHRPREDRQNIAFVFFSTALEQEGEMDWESTEIKWVTFDKLPKEKDFAFDHYKDLELYLEYKKGNKKIPILDFLI